MVKMFEDPEQMLLLLPFITLIISLIVSYHWMRSNNASKKEKEEKEREERSEREVKELAPAWLIVILHGMSELHDKIADDVKHLNSKIDNVEKKLDSVSATSSGVVLEEKGKEVSKVMEEQQLANNPRTVRRHSNPSSTLSKSKSGRKN